MYAPLDADPFQTDPMNDQRQLKVAYSNAGYTRRMR